MRHSLDPWGFVTRAPAVLQAELDASVTIRQHGVPVRLGSTSESAERCERAVSAAGAGPCTAAMTEHRVQLVAAVASETRWPVWSQQAAEEGFTSAAVIPAAVAPGATLALSLYSRSGDPWDAGLLLAADAYAQLVAALACARLQNTKPDASARLHRHLSDSSTIERAVGAIMHTNRCTADEAHRILESASVSRNQSRREVAEAILKALVNAPAEDAPRSS